MKGKKAYPEQIKVGRVYYDIVFDPDIAPDLGHCSTGEDKLIQLNPKQTRHELIKTLLHELLHAIENEYKLSLPHKHVHELEKPLVCLFRDNYRAFGEIFGLLSK